ncbi:ATP-binding cassette domain-containing protein [Cardiobacteriaceae bacterium TAE3-ERU3]|nr:ATP-binding cassette domain-containing protein [Cardiobacteriaceae bacterium TAE3-ERU3]
MLEVKNAAIYRDDKAMFAPLSFRVAAGEVLALMGPSGSGKSSLLNWMIGALPEALRGDGELWLNDERRDHLPTEQRRMAILLQAPLLFAHLSVGQNLLLAIPGRYGSLSQRRERAKAALAQAELSDFYHRDPATLSGGQQARVSVLRALLCEPQALLLDEPFSSLDHDLRGRFREFVFAHIAQADIPVLMVSHDPQDVPANGRIIHLNQDGYHD